MSRKQNKAPALPKLSDVYDPEIEAKTRALRLKVDEALSFLERADVEA